MRQSPPRDAETCGIELSLDWAPGDGAGRVLDWLRRSAAAPPTANARRRTGNERSLTPEANDPGRRQS